MRHISSGLMCLHFTLNMDAYVSHIHHFVTLLDDLDQKPLISDNLQRLLNGGVYYLMEYGTFFGLKELAQLSIQISELVHGPDHPNTQTSLYMLASLFQN